MLPREIIPEFLAPTLFRSSRFSLPRTILPSSRRNHNNSSTSSPTIHHVLANLGIPPQSPHPTPPLLGGQKITNTQAAQFNSTLASLLVAFSNSQIKGSYIPFTALNKTVPGWGTPAIAQDASTMICSVLADYSRTLSEEEVKMCNEIACWAAKRGQTGGLLSCLKRALGKGDTKVVLELFEMHVEGLKSAVVNGATLWGRKREADYIFPHALAAHAMKGSLRDAVASSLSTDLELSLDRFERSNLHTLVTPAVFERAKSYVSSIELARLLKNPQEFLSHIRHLFKKHRVSEVWKLYERIKEAYSVSDETVAWLAPIDGEKWKSKRLVALTEETWSRLVYGFMRAHRMKLADQVWKDMMALGIPMTTMILNTLLDGFGKKGDVDEALRVWKYIERSGMTKDVQTYTIMIDALFQARRSDEALALFRELRERWLKGDISESKELEGSSPSLLVTFNAVIHGLLIATRVDDAQELVDYMKAEGPKPDITTFNTLLRYYGRKGDLANFSATLRRIIPEGLTPDTVTFTMLLNALMRAGVSEAPQKVLAMMEAMGVQANVVTYTSIIEQLTRNNKKASFEAAMGMLDLMTSNGLTPNEVTYTGLIAGLYRSTEYDSEWVRLMTHKLLAAMRSKGMEPNRITYNILIKSVVDSHHTKRNGLEMALNWYREMVASGVNATIDTWYLLLWGAWVREDFKTARVFLDEMEKSGFVPTGRVAELVVNLTKAMAGHSFG